MVQSLHSDVVKSVYQDAGKELLKVSKVFGKADDIFDRHWWSCVLGMWGDTNVE